jgi:vanillate O-demethylase monooxygenase subunit
MTQQTFIKNAWYVAATADEIKDAPLGRTLCNHKVVLFRDQDGAARALEDFCPHRGAPLSLGTVEDGAIVCGYHGLKMGGDGRTVSMPGQSVERFPCIRTFPVAEKYGFVWFWPGDPDQADESLLPEYEYLGSDDWAYGGGLYEIACDYRFMIDNLMDLTHETYVHASSIGQKEIDEAPVNTEKVGTEVITSRYMDNVTAPPFWAMAMEAAGLDSSSLVDRWQVCRFNPPSHVMIEVGVALAGKGGYEAPAKDKVSSVVIDFITPETDTSILYFWGMSRSFKVQDQELTNTIREGQGKIFAEDLDMLESQQRNISANPERRLMKLNIDTGGVRSRLVIDSLIKQETQAAAG